MRWFDCIALLLLLLVVASVEAGRDFYKLLGVERNANLNQIKKAYRKLAKDLHPDKHHGDPEANERFSDINVAYEVLSDKEKRAIYDRAGEEGLAKAGGGGGGHDPFSSFFGDFRSFFHGGEEEGESETPRGATITMDLLVSLEEAYNGHFATIRRKMSLYKQTGGTRQCNCRHEMRTEQMGMGRFQMYQVKVCDECPNVKLVSEWKTLEVEVEAGADDGHTIEFDGLGEPHIDGDPGSLKFKVRINKHERFERKGDDLYTNVTISLQQALNGFTVDVPHLDGHVVKVEREKVTWPGARIRKAGEGMPKLSSPTEKGNLFVTFDVQFPRSAEFSEDQKKAIAELLQQSDVSPKIYNGLQGY